MDLDKIISLNNPKYDLWDKQFDEYLKAQYEPGELSNEEAPERRLVHPDYDRVAQPLFLVF